MMGAASTARQSKLSRGQLTSGVRGDVYRDQNHENKWRVSVDFKRETLELDDILYDSEEDGRAVVDAFLQDEAAVAIFKEKVMKIVKARAALKTWQATNQASNSFKDLPPAATGVAASTAALTPLMAKHLNRGDLFPGNNATSAKADFTEKPSTSGISCTSKKVLGMEVTGATPSTSQEAPCIKVNSQDQSSTGAMAATAPAFTPNNPSFIRAQADHDDQVGCSVQCYKSPDDPKGKEELLNAGKEQEAEESLQRAIEWIASPREREHICRAARKYGLSPSKHKPFATRCSVHRVTSYRATVEVQTPYGMRYTQLSPQYTDIEVYSSAAEFYSATGLLAGNTKPEDEGTKEESAGQYEDDQEQLASKLQEAYMRVGSSCTRELMQGAAHLLRLTPSQHLAFVVGCSVVSCTMYRAEVLVNTPDGMFSSKLGTFVTPSDAYNAAAELYADPAQLAEFQQGVITKALTSKNSSLGTASGCLGTASGCLGTASGCLGTASGCTGDNVGNMANPPAGPKTKAEVSITGEGFADGNNQEAAAEAPPGFAAAPAWQQHVGVSVAQLLASVGLEQYISLLEQQQVDMAALQLLEEQHLREMGLPIGPVVKIRAAVAATAGAGL